jgi:hypothetical protein
MAERAAANWKLPLIVLVVGGVVTAVVYNMVKPPTELGGVRVSQIKHTVEAKQLASGLGNLPPEVASRVINGSSDVPLSIAAWQEVQIVGDGKVAPGGQFNPMFVWMGANDGPTAWPVRYAHTKDSLIAVIPGGYSMTPSKLVLHTYTKDNPNLGDFPFPQLNPPVRRIPSGIYPTSVQPIPGITLKAVREGEGIALQATADKPLPDGQMLVTLISGHSFKPAVYQVPDPIPAVLARSGGRSRRGSQRMDIPAVYLKSIDAFDADVMLIQTNEVEGSTTLKNASLVDGRTGPILSMPSGATLTFSPGFALSLSADPSKPHTMKALLGNTTGVREVRIDGSSPIPIDIEGSPSRVFGSIDGDLKGLHPGPLRLITVHATIVFQKLLSKKHVVLAVTDAAPQVSRSAAAN